MLSPEQIAAKLDRILLKVQKPGRYVGSELNITVKDWDKVKAKVALVFPDIYDLGISNVGLKILYDQINQRDDALAERAYAPWVDMEAQMRANGIPLYALVTLGLSSFESVNDIEEIYNGILKELEPFDAAIIGGNISRVEGSPFIDITLIGTVNRDFKVLRSGARPGDAVMVTGCPGNSAAGYWIISNKIQGFEQYKTLLDSYIRPRHRAMEGRALGLSGKITSMIDLSDGLSGDLFHICNKSGVGAEIREAMLPSCRDLEDVSGISGIKKEDFILGASDDYELLFTCSVADIDAVRFILSGFNLPVAHIGIVVPVLQGITVIDGNGEKRALLKTGWDHFSK